MLEISQDDIAKRLGEDNPWWAKGGRVSKRFRDYPKRAYFKIFKERSLNWKIHRSVVLMGPRRVGKTVMLYQLINHCLSEGFIGSNILYASLETPTYGGVALEKLVEIFKNQTRHDENDKRIIIFDEVQYLKDWEVHLKVLTDRFPETRFIASGSAAAALKLKSQESGAGRFTDFLLPPLTFSEFLALIKKEEDLISSEPKILQVGSERFREGTKYKAKNINALNREFVNYINFGGYPEAVLIPQIREDISQYLRSDIIDKVLLRDLPSLYGISNIQELNRLFTTIAYHTGNEFSLDALSKASGVAKNTISKYLEYLEAAFLIKRVFKVNESAKRFKKNRTFKIYLTNPSMRAALFSPMKDGEDGFGHLVETAIFSQWFHSNLINNIHYARWKRGRTYLEVDLIHLSPSKQKPAWAVEIKWSDNFIDNSEKLRGLIEFCKTNNLSEGNATTKTKTQRKSINNILVSQIPSSLLCYQIGKNVTVSQNFLRSPFRGKD